MLVSVLPGVACPDVNNESAEQIRNDMLWGAGTGFLAGLTDGASLLEGSAARTAFGMASRAAINAVGEAAKECFVDHQLNARGIAGAAIGSLVGDSAEGSALASGGLDEGAIGAAKKAGASVVGGNVGAGAATAIGGPPGENNE